METIELDPPHAHAHNVADDAQTDKNLDMVRNILFGEQVRENERRQATLERFVRVWVNSLREDARKNFDALMHEINLLKDLLAEETKARRADGNLARERFDQVGKSIGALEQRITQETTRIGQEMAHQRDDILNQLRQATEQLQQDKTDRKTLATLLQNVAKQLDDDAG
jgi:glucose-6-phosphate-specific signal transduction histidine kinase